MSGFTLLLVFLFWSWPVINFINLSTARADLRLKEIGVRKTMGSSRHQLISQFLIEAVIVGMLSFMTALILGWVILPWFNELAAKQMVMPWTSLVFWTLGFTFTFFTSLLAGLYPAFYLSSRKTLAVLSGKSNLNAGGQKLNSLPRKVLVTFQFTISITLIIGTIFIYKQIEEAKDRPVGYNRDKLITLHQRSVEYRAKYNTLKNSLYGLWCC